MVLLFIGPPGSGKDTQADILAKDQGYTVVSTGEVMRDEIERASDLGLKAEEISSRGDLLPDQMIYDMLEAYLKRLGEEDLIFTGAVRRGSQVELLDETLRKVGLELDRVLYFEVPDEEIVERLGRRWYHPETGKTYDMVHKPPPDSIRDELVQRDDDKPEAIRERLGEFHENNDEVVEAYKDRGILIQVDGTPSVGEIADDVRKLLSS